MFDKEYDSSIMRDSFWFVSASLIFTKEIKFFSVGYFLHFENAIQDYDGNNFKNSIKLKSGVVISL